jgi:hypothetical protein
MPLIQGNLMIRGNDDGLVAVENVESQEYFQSLRQTTQPCRITLR